MIMARLTRDELIEKVRKYVGDRTDDETIEIIEDISDSIDSSDADEWKQKFEENDKMWRDKYISRFLEKKEDEPDTPTEHEEEEKDYNSFEDLFKEEED
jgi:hypothetical protein